MFLILFSTVGRREGKVQEARQHRGPAEFQEVPRPPPEKGPETQDWSPPNLEAVEGSCTAPARGLNLSVVEGPVTSATMAGIPVGVPGPDTHHGCCGDGGSSSQARTWQLLAALRQLTSGACPVGLWCRSLRAATCCARNKVPRLSAAAPRPPAVPPMSVRNSRDPQWALVSMATLTHKLSVSE